MLSGLEDRDLQTLVDTFSAEERDAVEYARYPEA